MRKIRTHPRRAGAPRRRPSGDTSELGGRTSPRSSSRAARPTARPSAGSPDTRGRRRPQEPVRDPTTGQDRGASPSGSASRTPSRRRSSRPLRRPRPRCGSRSVRKAARTKRDHRLVAQSPAFNVASSSARRSYVHARRPLEGRAKRSRGDHRAHLGAGLRGRASPQRSGGASRWRGTARTPAGAAQQTGSRA